MTSFVSLDFPKKVVVGDSEVVLRTKEDGPSFTPSKLVIPAEVAYHFDLLDLQVGGVSLFPTGGDSTCGLPAMLFSELAAPLRLKIGAVRPGESVVLRVRSRDTQREFFARLYGQFEGS